MFVAVTTLAMSWCHAPVAFEREPRAVPSSRDDAASATARVDAVFAPWNRPDSPGCSVGISRQGATIYTRGYGMASLEHGVPITPASVFHVAPVSKQFMAMSTLLLAERGRLSLDDAVRKHIPEWADSTDRLTIRHLLTHTGGLRDGFWLIDLAGPSDVRIPTNDRVVHVLARQRGRHFSPGSEYASCNGGYAVLAEIVRRVSGQSLRAFAEANIFEPLGMAHTLFQDDPTLIIPHVATGYSKNGHGFRLARPPQGVVGNAGLSSTVEDLLRWEENFVAARVGTPALLASMQQPTVLTGGETSPYGLGLQIRRSRGLPAVGHGGDDQGASAYVVRYPDQQLAIAVLCNLDGRSSETLTTRIADIYLPETSPSSSSDRQGDGSASPAVQGVRFTRGAPTPSNAR